MRTKKTRGRPRGSGYSKKAKKKYRTENYIPLSRKPSKITEEDKIAIRRHILLLATDDDVGYYMSVLADIYDTTVEAVGDILAETTSAELASIQRTRNLWERRARERTAVKDE